jgi:YVTN family beta-propeller protein
MKNHSKFVLCLVVIAVSAAAFRSTARPGDRFLLVLSKLENSLAIIDPRTKQILGRVPTGVGPHELAVSEDGKLAFVGNYGAREPGSTISVIELESRRELRRVDLGPLRRPHGMAVAEGKVYFTAEVNKVIGRYDPAANKIDWLLGTGQDTTHMILLSRDTSTIFTANIGSNSISMFERLEGGTGWRSTVIPVGSGPEGMDLSPDGRQLWAAHSRDGGLSIVDVATRKVIRTFDLQTRRSNRLKFSPDGKLALVSDMEGGQLVVLDVATGSVIKRIQLGASPEGILPAPDGTVAYVAVAAENKVAVVDLAKLQVTDRIEVGGGPDGMAWAPRE